MSENKEQTDNIASEDLKAAETGAEDVKPTEVVTESAGEMVAEEKPILKEKKEKKAKAESGAESADATSASLEDFDWEAYEQDGFTAQTSRATQEKQYEETLSTVAVDEVVEGKVSYNFV